MRCIPSLMVLALPLLFAVPQASAQAPAASSVLPVLAGPRPAPVFASFSLADSVAKPTQWKKGAIIGGASLGGAALLLGVAYLAGDGEGTSVGDVAVATLAGAALGAVLGGLIGGLFSGS